MPQDGAEKNKFGRVGKSTYLCIRFQQEIVEALYLRLADENLRNFHIGAREYDGFARIAWAVVCFSTKGIFSGPSSEEVVYGATLLL